MCGDISHLAPQAKRKKVLVAPLNWGLGHATRCIPVIRELLQQDADVIIASDGDALLLLKKEFPTLPFTVLPSYNIRYSSGILMPLSMLFQLPAMMRAIRNEHHELQSLIAANEIDIVISDNRYGMWSTHTKSVFITHQLSIRPPDLLGFTAPLFRKINFGFIRRFGCCWIPDAGGNENLSGELSHGVKTPFRVEFTGPLSRFSNEQTREDSALTYGLAVIISGPEPQRTAFEKLMTRQLSNISTRTLLVRGTDIDHVGTRTNGHVTTVNHLSSRELQKAINSSAIVVCRSGYSGIMDLAILQKKAILVPTPGQTEQEYLASYLEKKKICFSQSQHQFDLVKALEESGRYTGFNQTYPNRISEIIRELLN